MSALIVQLVGVGCGSHGTVDTSRLIRDVPGEIWDRSTWTRTVVIFDWTFKDQEDLRRWTPHGFNLMYKVKRGALKIDWSTDNAYLDASLDIDADDVEMIELTMRGLETQPDRLYWKGPEGGFSPSAWVSPKITRSQIASRAEVYSFNVRSHPEWKGKIRSLRVHMVTGFRNRARIERVRGLREDLEEQKLLEALERPWKVKLGPEIRIARVAKPNDVIAHEFSVPGSGGLWFGYGIWPDGLQETNIASVVFRIVAERPGTGDDLLFEDNVPVPRAREARWRSGWVDLASFADQRVRLRFETEAPFDGFPCFPVWGAPEVSDMKSEMPNVVLVSIDTLRADNMSLYGYPKRTTPNIDRWARQHGVVFENAIASSPWTLPSHVSMLTGQDALTHGVNHSKPMPEMLTTLAEILRDAGYATAAFTGGGYLHPSYGMDQGFDLWHSPGRGSTDLEHNSSEVAGFLKENRDRPFFLFFHTFEVHTPFHARQPFFSDLYPDAQEGLSTSIEIRAPAKDSDNRYDRVRLPFWTTEDRKWLEMAPEFYPMVKQYYDAGIAYTDSKIQELFELIENCPNRESLIIFTSDHGEHLGEQGLFGHFSLLDGNLRVPLVISLPGTLPAGGRIEAQVGSVDIVPTVLELLQLEGPAEMDGESLVGLINGREAEREAEVWSYSAIHAQGLSLRLDNDLKFIVNNSTPLGAAGKPVLYDLRKDPNETTDRSEDCNRMDELRRRVDLRLASRPGLHILMWNDSQSLVSGSLRSESLTRGGLKARQLPSDMVHELANSYFDFQLEAGRQAEIVVEEVRDDLLTVTNDWGQTETTEATAVWPMQGSGPWTFEHTGSGWRLVAASGERPQAGLQLRWIGPRYTEGDEAETEMPAELKEQLRALGYLE